MLERAILSPRAERPDPAETAAGARVRLADRFPRQALRRMSNLGLLIGAALDGAAVGEEDAVVFASTYAETRALEDFLASFPAASPLLFQTSIHPSAVQQILIGRQQPIRRLWPVTGRERLVESALLVALLEPATRVYLVGGEERGGWLLDQRMASDRSFAFRLLLATDAANAVGRIRFQPDPAAREDPCPGLWPLAEAVADRRALAWHGAGGEWSITWS